MRFVSETLTAKHYALMQQIKPINQPTRQRCYLSDRLERAVQATGLSFFSGSASTLNMLLAATVPIFT